MMLLCDFVRSFDAIHMVTRDQLRLFNAINTFEVIDICDAMFDNKKKGT
jgi:hypothetical protein